jgi:hypothetical protein
MFKTLRKDRIKIYKRKQFVVDATQHVSGIIFREIKLYARARNIPILDGLDCIILIPLSTSNGNI